MVIKRNADEIRSLPTYPPYGSVNLPSNATEHDLCVGCNTTFYYFMEYVKEFDKLADNIAKQKSA